MAIMDDFSFDEAVDRFKSEEAAQDDLGRLQVFDKPVLKMDKAGLLYTIWAFQNYISDMKEDNHELRHRYRDLKYRMEKVMNINIAEDE